MYKHCLLFYLHTDQAVVWGMGSVCGVEIGRFDGESYMRYLATQQFFLYKGTDSLVCSMLMFEVD